MKKESLFVEGEDYPAQSADDETAEMDFMTQAAHNAFGVRYLFAWQKLVIANILDSAAAIEKGEAAYDEKEGDFVCRGRQIVLLPTGAGKSMCFLVPALLLHGPSLVLYPLLALMSDQERRMNEGNLGAVMFKGGQSDEEREANFAKLKSGQARVILANPEVLQNEALVRRLADCHIAHIAIDEAHCVSEWGDSFRPAYLTLGEIIKKLGVQVVTAFTATASPPVLQRVSEVLFDGNAHLIQSDSDRANIHYEVRYAYAKQKAVLKAVQELEKPLIVFCGTRPRTEGMARLLAEYFGRERVRFYHAGMTKEEKNAVEQWFFKSDDGILTATCAYGMGMDKPNVKTVVHLDAPEHLENFVQEAGRAGRNGANVKSALVWSHADDVRYRQAPVGSREKLMGGYARSPTCRRQFILDSFAAEKTTCNGCDICDAERAGKTLVTTAEDAEIVYRFIKKNRRLYARKELTALLENILNKHDRKIFGINVWESSDVQEILSQLISERRIQILTGLWENHVDICAGKTNSLLAIIPRGQRHRLHLLRRHFRRLVRELQSRLS
ncbi:MAG: ATP-dependent DNA helicase RecQ [Treponema sp.]|nr:ATP-dependent DNA helicase RecQ [Treponema sp.]